MRIGELAAQTGITTETARFYEKLGLVPKPKRTEAGYRDYASAAVERIEFIRTAQTVGFTLDEIGEVLALRDQGDAPCDHVRYLIKKHSTELQQRINELQHMLAELQRLETVKPNPAAPDHTSHCEILEHRLDLSGGNT